MMSKQVFSNRGRTFLFLLIGILFSFNIFAQSNTVNGIVKDAKGEPIIGASILVKGTTKGTATDIDGKFSLSLSVGNELTVSYIGYETQQVIYKNQKPFVIVLKEDDKALDEVVVIGYGTVKKNDATGSVTAIKPDKFNRGISTTATDLLVGKIAGVVVTPGGGAPGSGATIRVRGGSSLSASNDPLIVIDGLAIDNEGIKGVSNFLSTINPNDIETYTVLKDASATAIYGSRASNGVIIITTKKGVIGAGPSVSYNGQFSVANKRNSVDVMGADEYRNYVKSTFGATSSTAKLLGTANTDWQKEIFRTAFGTDHSVSFTGGFKNLPVRATVGYTNENGILKTSNFERYTASLNLAPSFFDGHLTMNLNAKGMVANSRFADGGAIGAAIVFDPTKPVMDGNSKYGGYFTWEEGGNMISIATKNPVAMLMQKDETANSKNLVGNAQIDYKFHFLPELKASLNLGTDMATGKQKVFYPKESPIGFIENGKTGSETIDKYNNLLDFYLQYAKELNEDHRIDVMGGYSWQHFHRYVRSNYNNLNDNNPTSNRFKTESYLISFFGRVNYSFQNKYLLTATLRNDGSSKLSKDNRWALFPSVALGWKIKEERFLKDVNSISDLKLRLGYGITGTQSVGGDYEYIPRYEGGKDGAYYQFGDKFYPISRPSAYDPTLKWESTTTMNAGLDFGFLNNRITASVDYYDRKTTDLLNQIITPAGVNFSNVLWSNIGSLTNKGLEFSANGKVISTKDWSWDLGFNMAYNKNKVTKLTATDNASTFFPRGDIEGGTGSKVQAFALNHAVNTYYVYEQVYGKDGNPIEGAYVDRNNDGVVNEEDRYFYKKPAADVTMGLNSKLIYKQFDLSLSLRANLGNYVYNNVTSNNASISESAFNNKGYLSNRPLSAFETNFQSNQLHSDYYVQNASFLRCDNITFGYSIPKLFGRMNMRVFATVTNPFVITKYKGLDPEIFGGIDRNIYPRPTTGIVGLNLNF